MQALTGRWLALAALIAIVALGLALTATSLSAARTEAALRHQIAELVRQNRQAGARAKPLGMQPRRIGTGAGCGAFTTTAGLGGAVMTGAAGGGRFK